MYDGEDRLQAVVGEYRHAVAELLGDTLDFVVLYGSRARGDAREDSDIDVSCVMKDTCDYGAQILIVGEVSAALSLKYDVVLSTSFVTREDHETRRSPFLTNVRRDAVAV